MEEKIKQLRVNLDGNAKLIAGLIPSREVALARTACELSKMWLGKALQAIGTANPYPDSKDPSNEKIEPTADVFTRINNLGEYDNYSHIQKVKHIRKQLESIDGEIFDLWLNQNDSIGVQCMVAFEYSFKSCVEAGMYLGAELGRIKEEIKNL